MKETWEGGTGSDCSKLLPQVSILNVISYIKTILPIQEYLNDQKIIKAVEEQNQMEEDDRIKAHFKAKEIIAQIRKKKEAEMRR